MIRDYAQACAILGVPGNASQGEIKSAYRSLSKQLHPDSHPNQNAKIREAYLLVTEAYHYIEQNKNAYISRAGGERSRTAKVMGQPLNQRVSTENLAQKRRFDEKYKQRVNAQKQQKQEELKQRQAQMAQQKKEREILNEIRMIRLAQAIRLAMSDLEKKTGEELK